MNGKIALGAIGGIGLITTVSVVSSRSGSLDPSWEKEMPSFRFLSEDEAFMDITKGNSSSRFGYIYAGLLVGDADINDDWWEWSYENLKEDKPLESTFRVENVSTTVPDSEDTLKNWCKAVYEKDALSREPSLLFNNTSVWKYCSPIQTAPVSIEKSGTTYSERTVGKKIEKKLLALDGNDRIWYYRNKFFNETEAFEFEEGSTSAAFKEGRKSGRKIKDICADAYGQNEIGFPIREALFFCSISQLI